MLPVSVGSILPFVRALLNDQTGAVFTDTVILPYFQMAYDDMRIVLEGFDIPITNKTSDGIVIPTGIKNIGGEGGPPLPNDLVEILSISEREAGSSDNYLLMERKQFLPKTEVLASFLGVWSWQDQIAKFIGATQNIEVKIDYTADTLGPIINENSQIKFYNCRNYLRYRTSAHCALYIGENKSRSDELNNEAMTFIDFVVTKGVKTQQSIQTRRRPFQARNKSRGWGW